jgi:dTDP-4-dehydrorhamnose 3,5-epimerase
MNLTISNNKNISDILFVHYDKFTDHRGYLAEVFNTKLFSSYIDQTFLQEKIALSYYGVLRGLHYQSYPFEQGKLVRCISGSILDIAVDVRKNSKTYGQYVAHILDDKNNLMMYIPPGFAHGVLCLSKPQAIFGYWTTNDHSKQHECGLNWSDPKLNIQLPISIQDIILSDKDKELPYLETI